MPTAPQAAWPKSVIARYATVGGVADGGLTAVELTETGPRDSEWAHATVAKCAGCNAEQRELWETTVYYYGGGEGERTVREAAELAEARFRDWAQAHAGKCRAMVRPEGS
ncbi:hypothetical protein [Streptomyces sp. NPDC056670]|uniref:hypothetical protein n=1 Tax=Streptomyces sp. NPDC056670 TaxID=3345904 RepID=UPI0036A8841E